AATSDTKSSALRAPPRCAIALPATALAYAGAPMTTRKWILALPLAIALAASVPAASIAAEVPTPESVLGFTPGADRQLASWPQVLAYLEAVDAASDRVSIELAGKSTLGNDMPVVILTSPPNQQHLDRYAAITRRLA